MLMIVRMGIGGELKQGCLSKQSLYLNQTTKCSVCNWGHFTVCQSMLNCDLVEVTHFGYLCTVRGVRYLAQHSSKLEYNVDQILTANVWALSRRSIPLIR